MKLSNKIQVATFLPFFVIIATYHLYSASAFSEHFRALYRSQTRERLYQAEKDIIHYFQNIESELYLLTTVVPWDEENSPECIVPMHSLLDHVGELLHLSVLNSEGREWKRVEKYPTNKLPVSLGDYTNSDIYNMPMEKHISFWGNIDWFPNDRFPLIDVSVPISSRSGDQLAGVLWGRLSFRGIVPLLKRYISEEVKIVLISESAGVLVGSDDEITNYFRVQLSEFKAVDLMTEKYGWLDKQHDRKDTTLIYSKFSYGNLDYILIYSQPEEVIGLLTDKLRSFNMILVTFGVILFAVSSFFIIKTVTTPLVTLTGQITELRGKYRPKAGFPGVVSAEVVGDEVEELRNSFSLFQHQLSLYSYEREIFHQTLQNQVVEKTSELQKLNTALEASNSMLEADIIKRKEIECELEQHQRNLERKVNERTIELTLANEHLREQMEDSERMGEELLKARKLEAVGILAGGIAHDFNNILVAIMGNISLALRKTPKDSQVCMLLAEAQKGSKRASGLTNQLLTFSRGGDPVKKAHRIQEVVQECSGFILRGSSIKCNYKIADDLWPAEVDLGQISQVIQNIILNARQAMDNKGVIYVVCENSYNESFSLFPHGNGRFVHIAITDQGGGMSGKIKDKIFDPYITTKENGNGLGLAICHSIVKKHGGHIAVSSVAKQGATFDIYLPASKKNDIVCLEEKVACDSEVTTSSYMVLVMDDDDLVRNIASSILEQFGYNVLLAEEGAEAVRIYKEKRIGAEPVDLVIMDLTIPGGMGGEEAAVEILAIDPNAKIIVSSGYSNAPVMAHYQKYGFCGVIHKPFQVEDFISVVQKTLYAKS